LVAQHLTTRPTQHLDFFTRVGATNVPAARDALEIAAHEQGWSIKRIRDEATFCRPIINGADNLLVDLALDSPPQQPATASLIGPSLVLTAASDDDEGVTLGDDVKSRHVQTG